MTTTSNIDLEAQALKTYLSIRGLNDGEIERSFKRLRESIRRDILNEFDDHIKNYVQVRDIQLKDTAVLEEDTNRICVTENMSLQEKEKTQSLTLAVGKLYYLRVGGYVTITERIDRFNPAYSLGYRVVASNKLQYSETGRMDPNGEESHFDITHEFIPEN